MKIRTEFDRLLAEVVRQTHDLSSLAARPREVKLGQDHVALLREEASKGPCEEVRLDARGTAPIWVLGGLPVRPVEEPGVVRVVAE